MKVAIDARMIRSGSMHGIARYVYELLKCLSEGYCDSRFFVLINEGSPLLQEKWPSHIKMVVLSASWISFKEQLEIPSVLKRVGADLFHAPSFVAPILPPCKMIMTIHDLNHLVLPQFYTLLHQLYYKLIVRNSIKRSEYILTVSNFSKNEIVKTMGLPAEKIFVTYNGVSSFYRPVKDCEYLQYVREIYGLPENYILCISNNKPHKNVHQLVRAYSYSEITTPLVLACSFDKSLLEIAEKYGKKHLIYFTKFIEEAHLPAFYSMTDLFVYPSTYEGFGLPPLEALACGAPVVVSKTSSLPEVVGEKAIFMNPYDYKEIAKALERGIFDLELRSRLKLSGMQHANKYSWIEMTKQTMEVYKKSCHEYQVGQLNCEVL